jgi:hypothetical protein
MFVIPCKYTQASNGILDLIAQIRHHHPNEKIVVVDSDSSDKSYFDVIRQHGAIVEDIANKHWMIGAFWHGFKKYPDEDYYFFLHDSTKVKANMDYLKDRDLFMLAHFNRSASPSFTKWNDRVANETTIDPKYINNTGKGCYGPMWGCKPHVMHKLIEMGCDKFLPTNKGETGIMEGTFGLFFEALGYDVPSCSLYGDILELESPGGKSGPYPHNTGWQTPVEKYYRSLIDEERK